MTSVSRPDDIEAGMTDLQRKWWRYSNERERWESRNWKFWHEGYAAALFDHRDDYNRGYLDGVLDRKHQWHNVVEAARIDVARWGPLGREHFADHRPEDRPPGPVTWKTARKAA